MKATITSKGQITIPARLRPRLNLKAGQVLEFDESAPYLKATRAGRKLTASGTCREAICRI
jgi:AbrB family looped-hinge helix DNA binding protein